MCHGVVATGQAKLDEGVERAPNFRHIDGTWTPEWTCLRCNTTATPDHPLLQNLPPQPRCTQHGLRTLALDLQRGERGWVCTARPGSSHIEQCPPEAIPEQQPTRAPASPLPENIPTAPWLNQMPPQHNNVGPTNSWLYVPLLQAGAGRLAAAAEQTLASHPNSTTEWHDPSACGAREVLAMPCLCACGLGRRGEADGNRAEVGGGAGG